MLHSKILPQTSKKFTQIYLSYLWHFTTLLSVNIAYVGSLSLSSLYDRRHHPLFGNTSYEVSDTMLGWSIRLLRFSHGRTDGRRNKGTLRGPRRPKSHIQCGTNFWSSSGWVKKENFTKGTKCSKGQWKKMRFQPLFNEIKSGLSNN